MGRRGNPYDNAKAESFMKTLKVEAVYLMTYESLCRFLMRLRCRSDENRCLINVTDDAVLTTPRGNAFSDKVRRTSRQAHRGFVDDFGAGDGEAKNPNCRSDQSAPLAPAGIAPTFDDAARQDCQREPLHLGVRGVDRHVAGENRLGESVDNHTVPTSETPLAASF